MPSWASQSHEQLGIQTGWVTCPAATPGGVLGSGPLGRQPRSRAASSVPSLPLHGWSPRLPAPGECARRCHLVSYHLVGISQLPSLSSVSGGGAQHPGGLLEPWPSPLLSAHLGKRGDQHGARLQRARPFSEAVCSPGGPLVATWCARARREHSVSGLDL